MLKDELELKYKIASIWRDMGQPPTGGLVLLVRIESPVADIFNPGDTILGMPVLFGHIGNADAPMAIISTDKELDENVSELFNHKIKGVF